MADHLTRRLALAGGLATVPAVAFAANGPSLNIKGRYEQGGHAIVRTQAGASFAVDGEALGEASRDGLFIVGFDRDAAAQSLLSVKAGGNSSEHRFDIANGNFDVQKIDGLPEDQVTPEDPALLARIAEEAKRKAVGFASKVDGDWFKDGFELPLKAIRVSSRFGGQRILNGVPSRPHYGADLAAPVGTPVHAPAQGVVSFSETGLHYEGGLILIDHGQGLISAYLHLSHVGVQAGQMVKRGELIGAVGKEGRATGPHLCWRLKWRGRNLDPTLLVSTTPAKT